MLDTSNLKLLVEALEKLDSGFHHLPAFEKKEDMERMKDVLMQAVSRMTDNFPYPHPLYAGQMMKPPHPIAFLSYALAMSFNPNNHSLDGGRASSAMEKEAIAEIAHMFGWETHLGHLTAGGTMANMEALWVASRLNPGKKIVASSQAHYTHSRLSEVLQIDFTPIPVDSRARMDLTALEKLLRRIDIGTVVVTLGTTGVGAIDQLDEIIKLQKRYDFRIHVDAAYGGYFTLVDNLSPDSRRAFDCLNQVDSIVVDPHKHGLQPYGCGCVLFSDPGVGRIYKHDSPYTYFSSDDLHLGEISLECSRAGASAVALWATMKLLPLVKSGEFARDLENCREAALRFYDYLKADKNLLVIFPPELDIVVWAPRGSSASEISQRSREIFEKAAKANLHFALANLPIEILKPYWNDVEFDHPTVTCLRSCLMKPEHLDWLDRIREILESVISG